MLYQLTGSPALLGVLGIAKAVPTLLVQPLAGVIVDRLDQRRLLFATQGLALIASAVLGALILAERVEPWHIYVQTAIVAAISAFDVAVRQALFPRLVARHHVADAVTLSSTAGRAAALLGPAIGGVAIVAFGVSSPFLLNAATFLALMAAVVLMRDVEPTASEATARVAFRHELLEGLRHVWSAPTLSGILRLEIVFGIFQINPVIVAIVAQDVLHVGADGLGVLLSAPAVGSIVGIALLLAHGQPRRGGRFVVACQLAYAGSLLALALSGSFGLSLVILGVTGLLDIFTTVTRLSIMQLAAPPAMRGRVMANMRTVTGGIGPFAQTQSGFLSGLFGGPAALVLAGLALAISATAVGRTSTTLWHSTLDDLAFDDAEARRGVDPRPAI